MPVPTSLESLLDEQQVRYDITRIPTGPDKDPRWRDQHLRNLGAAIAVLLEDRRGRVLVLLGADTLLDLNLVNQHLERELRATSVEDQGAFCKVHQLLRVPAVPKLANLPTLIDHQLLDRTNLLLDAGDDEHLLHVRREDFEGALAEADVTDVAVPLESLEEDQSSTHDEEQITGAVRHFTRLRIKQRLEETLELPPLSETAQRIIKLRVDPDADISDLAEVVETDPSLTAQIVSWAASPYYSARGRIRSLQDAIVRVLGFDMVLNLSLGLCLGRALQLPKDGPAGYLPYWQEAVYTASTIEGLVAAIPKAHRPSFGMAYLSGLLHSFGYLILAEVFPPHFRQYCRFAEANAHVTPQVIERHLLGVTRDQLASTLMSLWSMPDEVVKGVRHQGNPHYQGEHQAYAKLVFLAKRLLVQEGVTRGPSLSIPDQVFADLHLDPADANAQVAKVVEARDELDHIALEISPT